MKSVLRGCLCLMLSVGVASSTALAKTGGTGCDLIADPAEVAKAQAKIKDLFQRHTSGGPAMSQGLQEILVRNPDAASDLISLAERASPEQTVAIGAALGKAAGTCASSNPELVARLNNLVKSSGNVSLLVAFSTHLPAEAIIKKTGGSFNFFEQLDQSSDPTDEPGFENRPKAPSEADDPKLPLQIGPRNSADNNSQGSPPPSSPGPYVRDDVRQDPKFAIGPLSLRAGGPGLLNGVGGGVIATSNNIVSPTR